MRERVEDEWNELRQKEGESTMSFYGRAKAIRMKLQSYGDQRPDASMCKHIARRMLPSLKICSDHVLLLPDLSSRTMEDLLRRAAHELERSGRPGEEREETGHALVAAGVGRGDRGGRNAAGDQGYSATAGKANRTHTARTTARGKATTPRNASSCAEYSKDTSGISKSTCICGDSGHTQPDAEVGAGR